MTSRLPAGCWRAFAFSASRYLADCGTPWMLYSVTLSLSHEWNHEAAVVMDVRASFQTCGSVR